MLDLRFVRENPDIVKQNIKNKFQDSKLPLVDEVISLDTEARATQKEADDLRASRNKLSKQIGMLMGQGKKDEAEAVKQGFPARPRCLKRPPHLSWFHFLLDKRDCQGLSIPFSYCGRLLMLFGSPQFLHS